MCSTLTLLSAIILTPFNHIMTVTNFELVNGIVPISTNFSDFQRVCIDDLTIAGLRHEGCPLHFAEYSASHGECFACAIVCATSCLAETSYKVNNCFGGSSSPESPCMVAALFRVHTTHNSMG